jgi:hypothetical protein
MLDLQILASTAERVRRPMPDPSAAEADVSLPLPEEVRRQQVYLNALLQALDAVAAHLDATRQVFAVEIENLSSSSVFASGHLYGRPPRRS